jgi:hypothetical protein
MADDWTQANVREIQHELEAIRQELRGRTGNENGGGLRGSVRRVRLAIEALEERVAVMDKTVEVKLTRINFWLLTLTVALFLLVGLVTLLTYIMLVIR